MLAGVEHQQRGVSIAALVAAALVVAAYGALFWSLDSAPFQDLPVHLTRATIEQDIVLHGGQRFGKLFAFDPALEPYIGGDALLASLVAIFGQSVAVRLWVIVIAASLPLALALYLRAAGYSGYSILLASIVGMYLSTDWFFLAGMHHFRLAVAFVLMALAAWEIWLRNASLSAYAAWTVLVAVGYLVHLSALLFTAASAAVIGIVAYSMRQVTWRRVAAGLPPLAVVFGWHLATSRLPSDGGGNLWGGAVRKVLALGAPFARYEWPFDGALLLGLGLVCLLLLIGSRVERTDRRCVTAALLTLTFIALYAAMPFASGPFSHLDVRAVPLAAAFALVAVLAAAEKGDRQSRTAVWLALVLAVANLALLATHLERNNHVLRAYRRMALRIPRDARVLPVATRPLDGFTNPFLHAGAFVTLDAGAYTPYLPAGGTAPYFRYRSAPSVPLDQFWYQTSEIPDPGSRAAIEANFQYLLVMNPFDAARLPVNAEVVVKSHTATLLRVIR